MINKSIINQEVTPKRSKIIEEALTKKNVNHFCLSCGQKEIFYFKEGKLILDMDIKLRKAVAIPILTRMCDNCGYVDQYSINCLEIPPKATENDK